VYSKIENCHTIDEIAHPAVREVLRYLKIARGVEIHHDGDLPARSGLGSSSAFTVGLLHALYALTGQMTDKQKLAKESIHIEQDCLRETVGSQDQVLAAYGGFAHVTFAQNDEICVRPMTLSQPRIDELNSSLMLLFTGINRTASTIADTYVNDIRQKEQQFRLMAQMVTEGISILSSSDDIGRFGTLLNDAWQAKRTLSPTVSNPSIEQIYQEARAAGAIGGKLIGAGGGGFMLLFARPEDHLRIRERLRNLLHVPFKFEDKGSQIIFYDPENDYAAEERARAENTVSPFKEHA
jgi:D-glycero-alpha-D-manno-heptose-7-phosphate kinase